MCQESMEILGRFQSRICVTLAFGDPLIPSASGMINPDMALESHSTMVFLFLFCLGVLVASASPTYLMDIHCVWPPRVVKITRAFVKQREHLFDCISGVFAFFHVVLISIYFKPKFIDYPFWWSLYGVGFCLFCSAQQCCGCKCLENKQDNDRPCHPHL